MTKMLSGHPMKGIPLHKRKALYKDVILKSLNTKNYISKSEICRRSRLSINTFAPLGSIYGYKALMELINSGEIEVKDGHLYKLKHQNTSLIEFKTETPEELLQKLAQLLVAKAKKTAEDKVSQVVAALNNENQRLKEAVLALDAELKLINEENAKLKSTPKQSLFEKMFNV